MGTSMSQASDRPHRYPAHPRTRMTHTRSAKRGRNRPTCSELCRPTPKCTDVRRDAPTCADACRHAPMCTDMRRHAPTCADARRRAPTCTDLCPWVPTCSGSERVGMCQNASRWLRVFRSGPEVVGAGWSRSGRVGAGRGRSEQVGAAN